MSLACRTSCAADDAAGGSKKKIGGGNREEKIENGLVINIMNAILENWLHWVHDLLDF